MSVTLSWSPVETGYSMTSATKSQGQIKKALEAVFGELPRTLGAPERDRLEAMSAAHGSEENPYQTLLDAVKKHGEILVEAQY